MAVSVFEDNENGAYLEYEPTHSATWKVE
jgi:hypothetical protein